MVKKYRDLTEKYRSLRLKPDAIYQSRTIQTLFNKFTKRGKKAVARRHLGRALMNLRFTLKLPRLYNTLMRTMRLLQVPLSLVLRRQAKVMLEVPTPVRRNQAEIMSLQTFAAAIKSRRERGLYEKLEQELLELTVRQSNSSTLRQKNIYMRRIHDERPNIDKR